MWGRPERFTACYVRWLVALTYMLEPRGFEGECMRPVATFDELRAPDIQRAAHHLTPDRC